MPDVIEKRIYQIENILSDNLSQIKSGGLSEGILGTSLFYFYFYQLIKDEALLEKISGCIDQSANLMHDNSDLELIEFGRYLCFLNVNGFLNDSELLPYLNELDKILDKFLQSKLEAKDLDAISGIIPLGHYYLAAMDHTHRSIELLQIFDLIKELAIECENGISWTFIHPSTLKTNIELGLTHGISGVANLLISFYDRGIEKQQCLHLINNGIKYILRQSNKKGQTIFPIDVLSNKRMQYFNLAYGDIGIGYIIFKAGMGTNQEHLVQSGLEIIENASHFRDDQNLFIKDAELVYGSAGLHLIFDYFYTRNNNPLFLSASEYWLNKSLSHNQNNTPWGGYDTYINGFHNYIQLSFSHGICGIGISFIQHKINVDSCLQFLNFY